MTAEVSSELSSHRDLVATTQCNCWSTVEQYCGCANHSQSISLPSSTKICHSAREYIPERRKTMVVFVFFMLTVLLNHFVLAVISDIISREPLPDLMHSLLKQNDLARPLADWFALAGSLGTFIFCCILHKHRWIVARRLWYIGSVLFLMRSVSVCVTHIPSSYQRSYQLCVDPSEDPDPSYQRTLKNFAQIFVTMGLQVTDSSDRLFCGDMLFSGHTTTISTCCFFLNYYMPHFLWPLKFALVLCCLVAMTCLIASRAHYTVDVIISYWISNILFSLYHGFCEIPQEMRPKTRAFRRLLIFWTMFETERKVPSGRLPNVLEWPLPWPKSCVTFVENLNSQSEETMAGRVAKWLANHRLKLHM